MLFVRRKKSIYFGGFYLEIGLDICVLNLVLKRGLEVSVRETPGGKGL